MSCSQQNVEFLLKEGKKLGATKPKNGAGPTENFSQGRLLKQVITNNGIISQITPKDKVKVTT